MKRENEMNRSKRVKEITDQIATLKQELIHLKPSLSSENDIIHIKRVPDGTVSMSIRTLDVSEPSRYSVIADNIDYGIAIRFLEELKSEADSILRIIQ